MQYGANPDIKYNGLDTPVFAAILVGSLPILRRVLEAGARVNIKNYRNETPLQVANMANWPEGVELLYQYGAKE